MNEHHRNFMAAEDEQTGRDRPGGANMFQNRVRVMSPTDWQDRSTGWTTATNGHAAAHPGGRAGPC